MIPMELPGQAKADVASCLARMRPARTPARVTIRPSRLTATRAHASIFPPVTMQRCQALCSRSLRQCSFGDQTVIVGSLQAPAPATRQPLHDETTDVTCCCGTIRASKRKRIVMSAIARLLYGSIPATFKSAFGLAESVARLCAATKQFGFFLTQPAAVGSVSETHVKLRRVVPLLRNSFKPFFFGRFEQRDDGVYLTGRFTTPLAVKVFMSFWLAGVLAIAIPLAAVRNAPWWARLPPFGLLAFGLALIGVGTWLGRNDAAWLSDVIQRSLGTPGAEGAQGSTPASGTAPPVVLRVVALVLLLMGAGNLSLTALAGVTPWHASPGAVITAACGVYLPVLAWGVYRARRWAWWQVLVLIALQAPLAILRLMERPEPLSFRVLGSVMSPLVVAAWAAWWYGQRVHFVGDQAPWRAR